MFYELGTKELACDNQSASHLKSIQYFHKTKHLEVDSQFIRDKILTSNIKTLFVGSNDHLADMLAMFLLGPRIAYICNN